MQTLAWILILAGGLLFRQVATGRAGSIREDFTEGFTAFVSGDTAKLGEVAARRGKNITPVAEPETLDTQGASTPVPVGPSSTALIAEMRKLGAEAGGNYQWGGTNSSTGYDCSGLVYRAMRNLGIYKGARFTTATFPLFAATVVNPVQGPQIGDIVLWQRLNGGHMGIVIGKDRMYSALSERHGIIESKISSERGTPSYWRVVNG